MAASVIYNAPMRGVVGRCLQSVRNIIIDEVATAGSSSRQSRLARFVIPQGLHEVPSAATSTTTSVSTLGQEVHTGMQNSFGQQLERMGINIREQLSTAIAPGESAALDLIGGAIRNRVADMFNNGIMFIMRTFQPSLVRMKRKHGFLARQRTRGGQKVLNRRRFKGRRRLCS